jgi:hypothetical protein
MKSNFTNFYVRLSLLLALVVGLSANDLFAQQGFAGGRTYIVNGAVDLVFPRDTFANLMGPNNTGALVYLSDTGVDVTKPTGTITILLSSGYTGTEPSSIRVGRTTGTGYPNMGPNRPVVLKPAPGLNFTITTATAIAANNSLFRIFGSTDFTVDGSGTPGQRNITFQMISPTAGTRVVDIIPSATARIRNVNIRNCNIIGNSTATAINTYAGIYFGGITGTPSNALVGTNLNIAYTNNYIVAVQNGIYHRGFPTAATNFPCQDTGINISNNIIGDWINPLNAANTAFIGGAATSSGIALHTVSNSTVSNNTIKNTLIASGGFAGIRLLSDNNQIGLDSNIRIVRNSIYNLYTNSVSQGIFGIRVSLGAHTTSRRLLVANNSISKIAATIPTNAFDGASFTTGILVDNNTANVGLELYYNSISLTGDTISNNGISACFVTGVNTTGGIIMLNNSFANTMGRTVGSISGYQNYVIIRNSPTANPIRYSNFNNFYTNTLKGGYAFVAALNFGGFYRQISTLRNYRLYNASDSNSFGTIPPYSANDSVLTVAAATSHRMYNRAYSLTQLSNFSTFLNSIVNNRVIDDILGNTRTGLGRFSSIGCHQWVGDSTNNPAALQGGRTYAINGNVSSPPLAQTPNTGSFRNMAEAITYLNAYGISANQTNVILELRPGYQLVRETDWIPAITDYPGFGPSNNVIIRMQNVSGYDADTIWSPNAPNPANTAVLRFMGGRNITLDGGTGRKLTVMMRNLATTVNSRVIAISPSDTSSQNITLRNLNIVGNTSTTAVNTSAGIYMGQPIIATETSIDTLRSVANTGFNFEDNYIQGVRYGIRVSGSAWNPTATAPVAPFAATGFNVLTNRIQNLNIVRNIIGGTIAPGGTLNTTFIGGSGNASQGGIYVRGFENATIDSNVIRNCVPTALSSNGFVGILIDESNVVPANLNFPNYAATINRNFIYNLRTLTGTTISGIRFNFGGLSGVRNHLVTNNFIARIDARGTGGNFSNANPAGIVLDAASPQSGDLVTLANNTVNMNGADSTRNFTVTANNGISALFIAANITSGVSSTNNIFAVTGNRTTAGNKYAVLVGAAATPFRANTLFVTPPSNFNAYFVSGGALAPLTNHFLIGSNNGNTNGSNINSVRAFTGAGADLSSFSWPTRFVSDTLPDLISVSAGSRYATGGSVAVILTDIYGRGRLSTGSSLGAVNFDIGNSPLQPGGIYQINGADTFPSLAAANRGSFRTVRSAVEYLNAFGTGLSFTGVNAAKLVISAGYVGETDTFLEPIKVLDFPSANINVPVVLTVAADRQDTIRFTKIAPQLAGTSLFRISSAKFFNIDGSNNGTKSRDLTILMPSVMNLNTHKMIDIISGQESILATSLVCTNNSVSNCNLVGNSTATANNTFAAIYMGGITATPSNSAGTGANNNNSFVNNFIGACQYGIYLRGNGTRGQQDLNTYIAENTIGGDIAPGGVTPNNYFGGVNNAAAIFMVGQNNATIERNIIQNNILGFSNPRAIELGVITGSNTILNASNTINGNIITRIRSTIAGSGAYGIYINYGADALNATSSNNTNIHNNMISGITALGSATFMNNPYGIALDAGITVDNANIRINYNSINLGTANTLTAGQSACLAVASGFTSTVSTLASSNGLRIINNIFKNKLGGNSFTSRASGVVVGNLVNPFSISNNNNYFVQASSATNAEFTANASATPIGYSGWDNINKYTNDDVYSTSFDVPFTNDSNLFIPALTNSVFLGAATPITGITSDVAGNPRNFNTPTMGAHEYTGGAALDSVAPRIVPATLAPCLNAIFNTVSFIVADKNYLNDTLYYRVNGGATSTLQSSSSSINSSGLQVKTYTIPSSAFSAPGSTIEYRIGANDIAPNRGVYPMDKEWDTLQTGISTFPYMQDFENGAQGWSSQSVTNGAIWDLTASGSNTNPSLPAASGLRCAMFGSATLPANSRARLISPCFNFSVMQLPTLRISFAQSNNTVTARDSIAITVLVNGSPTPLLKFALRPNNTSPFADYFPIELCLSDYKVAGLTYKIQIEGISAGGGQNMLIDDITVFDDIQNQVISPTTFTICNASQPIQVNIPNTDNRFFYRAFEVDKLGNRIAILDSARGLGVADNLILNLANRQTDTLRYIVSAINYNSQAFQQAASSVPATTCSNNLPNGPYTAIINRFNRAKAEGYITVDQTPNAFNGAANAGSPFEPDGVKVGNTVTYNILSPTANYTNASYGTAWTVVNTSITETQLGTPVANMVFTPATASAPAKVAFTPVSGEADLIFVLNTTIRFLATNCDTTVSRFIRVANPLVFNFLTAPRVDSACSGNNLDFVIVGDGTAAAGNKYFWDFGDGTFSNFGTGNGIGFTAPVKKIWTFAGIYDVGLIIETSLGLRDSVKRQIRVLQSPSDSFSVSSNSIVCQKDSTYFTSTATGSDLVYLWNFPSNITRSSAATSFSFDVADTNYAVKLRVTDSKTGCFAERERVFPSYAKPVAGFTLSSHCQGALLPYQDTSKVANNESIGLFWDMGYGSDTRVSKSFEYIYPEKGTYIVKLKAITQGGCVDSATRTVTVYETPKPDFTTGSVCVNDSATFTNQTIFSAGIQNVDYTWDFGDNSGFDNRQDAKHKYLSNNSNIPFKVKLTASNRLFGCKDSITKDVKANISPTAIDEIQGATPTGLNEYRVCEGTNVVFTSKSFSPDQSTITCLWLFGTVTSNGTQSGACNAFAAYPPSPVGGSYKYTLFATANNCQSSTSGFITVVAKPTVTYTKQRASIPASRFNVDNKVTFKASVVPAPASGTKYTWYFGDADSSSFSTTKSDSAEFIYNRKGNFRVRVVVLTPDGCETTYSDTVNVSVGVGINEELSAKFNLNAYPNPFANNAFISFNLENSTDMIVTVTDVLGRTISNIDLGKLGVGKHEVELNENLFTSAGTYFIKVKVGDEVIIKTLIKQ